MKNQGLLSQENNWGLFHLSDMFIVKKKLSWLYPLWRKLTFGSLRFYNLVLLDIIGKRHSILFWSYDLLTNLFIDASSLGQFSWIWLNIKKVFALTPHSFSAKMLEWKLIAGPLWILFMELYLAKIVLDISLAYRL